MMKTINRVISKENLNRFVIDFKNIIKIVNNSKGELDLAIRDDYINLYFKGNSLAKIEFLKGGRYRVIILKKFFEGTKADHSDFYEQKRFQGEYVSIVLSADKPPIRFLQKAHINQFCAKIKKVNYGEEIIFEQALITDNQGRKDLIIIDRQVSDKKLGGKRLDLLALKQLDADLNRYHFLIMEVKLGKNPELNKDVAAQLNGYVEHITEHFEDYKECYQRQFIQRKAMGLNSLEYFSEIIIDKPVRGIVVVGGYSKMAEKSIEELKSHYPDIDVKLFEYKL